MIPAHKLAPYLPFDLQFEGGGDIWTLYSMSKNGAVVLKNGLHTIVVNETNVGTEYRPILRPLSDMNESEREIFFQHDDSLVSGIRSVVRFIGWLLENHFDVYRLIESGQATSIKRNVL